MNCPLTNITHKCERRECAWWNRKLRCCNEVVKTKELAVIAKTLSELIVIWQQEKWRNVFQRK